MKKTTSHAIMSMVTQFRDSFKTRDFMFHDGRDLRRFSIAGRTQAALAAVGGVTLCFSAYGVAQAAVGAVAMTGVFGVPVTAEARVAQLQGKLQAMRADIDVIKQAAATQAARVEKRQALIAAVLQGKGDARALALDVPQVDQHAARVAAEVIAPLRQVEARQVKIAVKARLVAEQRYSQTAAHVRRLGLAPERFAPRPLAMGGPYEPIASGQSATEAAADAQFRSLFMTWKKLDSLEKGVIAIPSAQPTQVNSFTSLFGVRSDPFRGTAAMHPGVDIPGAIGTPIYATADGIVARAERTGGYGNMVEINHGRGIATRYGHMSKILIPANVRVVRGQLIGLMGSTGRSTGSHLHYEVRIDGQAVNPVPFLQNGDYLLAVQDRVGKSQPTAIGGPAAN